MKRRKNALMPLFHNKAYFETRLLLLTDDRWKGFDEGARWAISEIKKLNK